jgi:hypothetical protein
LRQRRRAARAQRIIAGAEQWAARAGGINKIDGAAAPFRGEE